MKTDCSGKRRSDRVRHAERPRLSLLPASVSRRLGRSGGYVRSIRTGTYARPDLEKALVFGVEGGLGTVAQPEPGEDPRDVVLDRALAEVEPAGDLTVGRAGGDQSQDLDLARSHVPGT